MCLFQFQLRIPPYPLDTNTLADGHHGVAPADAYGPQNKYGMYNMIGNAWEWVADEYVPGPQEVRWRWLALVGVGCIPCGPPLP